MSIGRFLPEYIHATWAVRDHKRQGSVRKFVFVTPDSARRASRAGANGLVQHCRLPVGVGKPKPEPPRDSPPGSPARRPRSGSADRTRPHRSALASEEHICGLTSPRAPRRHTVSTASPNRPGATPKPNKLRPPPAVAVTSSYPPRRSHFRMSRAAHRGGSVPTTSRLEQPIRHRAPPQY